MSRPNILLFMTDQQRAADPPETDAG